MKPESYTLPTFRAWRFRTEFFAPTATKPLHAELTERARTVSAGKEIAKTARTVFAKMVETVAGVAKTDAAPVISVEVSEASVRLVVLIATAAVHATES